MSLSWSSLCDDVKKLIVELLDYEARCNMRLCSKGDKTLVDSTKFVADKIQIVDIESESNSEKSTIRIDIDNFSIWFTGVRNVTKVERGWNGYIFPDFSEFKQYNRFELAKTFLDKYSVNFSCYELEIMNINLPSIWKFRCQKLSLRELSHEVSLSWLENQMTPKFKSLFVTRQNWTPIPLPTKLLDVTDSLNFRIPILLNDNELEKISPVDLSLASLQLTQHGVRNAVSRFLTYGKAKDKLELRFSLSNDSYFEALPKSLILEKTKLPPDRDYYFEVKITGGFLNLHNNQSPRVLTMFENGDYTVLNCEIEKVPDRDPCQLW